MKRIAAIAALVMLMGVLAAPVQASLPASIDNIYFQASATTVTEPVTVYGNQDFENGYGSFQVSGGTFPNYWYCYDNIGSGTNDLFPDLKLQGKDTMRISGDFLSADFDNCSTPSYYYTNPPTEISLDLVLEAAVVQHQKGHTVWVKGQPSWVTEKTTGYDQWVRSQVDVSGSFNGDAVIASNYGYFQTYKYL